MADPLSAAATVVSLYQGAEIAFRGLVQVMRGRLGKEERELVSDALVDALLADWKRKQRKRVKWRRFVFKDKDETALREKLKAFAADLAISPSRSGDTRPEDGPVGGWRHEFAAELQTMAEDQKRKDRDTWVPVIGEDAKAWSSHAVDAFEAKLRDSDRGRLVLNGLDRGDSWAAQVAIAEAMRSIKQTLIGIAGSLVTVAGGVTAAVEFLPH